MNIIFSVILFFMHKILLYWIILLENSVTYYFSVWLREFYDFFRLLAVHTIKITGEENTFLYIVMIKCIGFIHKNRIQDATCLPHFLTRFSPNDNLVFTAENEKKGFPLNLSVIFFSHIRSIHPVSESVTRALSAYIRH